MTISMRPGAPPLIVFIAALGDGGDVWKPVISQLPGAAVFTYDRPGCGDAPARPAPNPPLPFSAFADELATLLDERGVAEPFVLVGHSIGGSIARAFADRHPHRVAGLVFVDASLSQSLTWPQTDFFVDGDGPGATTVDVITGHVELLQTTPLNVPAVVLTRRRHWWIPNFEAIPHPALDDLWHVSQQILARDWHAPLIVAENSGHYVPLDAPDLVAQAIDGVARAIRNSTPVTLDARQIAKASGTIRP
ncbi:alpha/beta fold hydrolase [Paractinoplanes durhamensis]|nr:alpha/beta fold hydrolase [Actinoplanes durhamensis]